MPCYEPRTQPAFQKTKLVCELLAYVQTKQPAMILPNWVRNAINGAPDPMHLHHATNMLCGICKNMTEHEQARVIYNPRDGDSRRLADWWEQHQKDDAMRDQTTNPKEPTNG